MLTNLDNPKILLFGSIAKGCYSKYSDIDLLDSYKPKKELRQVRHDLEDSVDIRGWYYGTERYVLLR